MSELRLNTDGHIIKFGADNDVSLTHVADTGLLLNSTMQLQFNDASQNINAPSATVLDINATDEIELNATLVDINSNVEISGTATTTGVHTFSATPVFPDGSLALADLDIDGGTDIGAAIVDADLFIIDDGAGGTNRKTTAARLKTYIGGAVTALNNATANELVTVGGTTTELDAEANLTFDGEVLKVLGNPTTVITQDYNLSLDNDTDGATSGNAKTGILFRAAYNDNTSTDLAGITAGKENTSNGEYGSFISFNTRTNGVNEIAERMRIVSTGQVNINGSTGRTSTLQIMDGTSGGQEPLSTKVSGTANASQIAFLNPNGAVGYINTADSATAYATSSDYRLKENVDYDFDATARLKQLKPARFNWKTNADKTLDGFLAHEVSSIIPEAILGEKDAMHPEVLYTAGDELPEGKEIGDVKEVAKPNHQAIDQSKLIPLLVKSLQEAITKIETLETKVTTLENA